MNKIFLLSASMLLISCSTQSNHIYISEKEYDGYSCSQLTAELKRVGSKLEPTAERATNNVLEKAISIYAISEGFTVDNDNPERDALQTRYNIVEKLLIKNDC